MRLAALYAILISSTLNASEITETSPIIASPTQVEQILTTGQSDFVNAQKQLIEGKKLSLWGVTLFAGSDIFSAAIKLVTDSKWSHVGLIFTDENGIKYSYESTGSASEIISQHVLPQVQIRLWNDVIAGYSGKATSRQFVFTDTTKNNPDVISSYVYNKIGTPYEKSIETLLKSIFRDNTSNEPASVFCSEEAARVLMTLDYLDPSRVADNYLPKDFSDKEFIPLIGCKLGKQINVTTSGRNCGCTII